MKQYKPSKSDKEFEDWWYSVYADKPSMLERQVYEAGYQAGQTSAFQAVGWAAMLSFITVVLVTIVIMFR